MKKSYIFIGVIVIFAMMLVSSYNSLVGQREKINEQSSAIETVLQRRYDLIPNLVETVKAYTKHEEEVFVSIAEARQMRQTANKSGDKAALAESETMMEGALERLLMIVENYPELKADAQYISLMDQLEGTENRIAFERKKYNEVAQVYNSKIKKFPTNIMASMFGFEKVDYFAMDEAAKDAPKVNFKD